MSGTNNLVFKGLKIVTWIIFVGLCIEAGGLLVNFIVSIYNPEFVQNLYQKLDLSQMYERSKLVFFGMYGFVLIIAILKAVLFYVVIDLITNIDLTKPFNADVSRQISLMSYYTLAIGLLILFAKQIAKDIESKGFAIDRLNHFWVDSQAFILMAAVIYVIATIFSKGVEFQEELEQTI